MPAATNRLWSSRAPNPSGPPEVPTALCEGILRRASLRKFRQQPSGSGACPRQPFGTDPTCDLLEPLAKPDRGFGTSRAFSRSLTEAVGPRFFARGPNKPRRILSPSTSRCLRASPRAAPLPASVSSLGPRTCRVGRPETGDQCRQDTSRGGSPPGVSLSRASESTERARHTTAKARCPRRIVAGPQRSPPESPLGSDQVKSIEGQPPLVVRRPHRIMAA